MMTNQIEELILKEVDLKISQSNNQLEKLILDLFKSAILKKYKDQYNTEILKGEVKTETINKYIDFLFADTCVKFRSIPTISDVTKDTELNNAKEDLDTLKIIVTKMLSDRGVKIQ